ncbi:hypothetical protein ScPMuIL_007170 [Solemya velum]
MPTVPPVDYGWQSEKSILECHQHMLEEGIAADVTFIVGKKKQEVRAHKYMLICRSPVFQAMFCGPLAEDNNIVIPDIEPDVFFVLLRFMYYDKSSLNDLIVLSVLYAANKYLVDGLVKVCKDYIENNMDADNACLLLQGSVELDITEIRQACIDYIVSNGQDCLKSKSFGVLSDVCVKELVSSDDLAADELTIWESLVRWSDSKCQERQLCINDTNRRNILGDLVYSVRFRDMDPGVFAKNVSTSDILSLEEKCLIFQFHHHVTDVLKHFSSKSGRRCEEEISRLLRFEKHKCGIFNGGRSIDGIVISVSKKIYLYGIVSYRFKQDCSIVVTLCDEVSNFQYFEETHAVTHGVDITYDVMFRKKIALEQDKLYKLIVDNPGDYSAYGGDGKSEFTIKHNCIKFHDARARSGLSPTSITWGQIPGLLFKQH